MLLPYASDRPPRNPPLAVVTLVLLNFVVIGMIGVVIYARGDSLPVLWYANLGLIPSSIRWYSLVTYAFLHQDIFHLSGNMLFLWVFGGSVEDALKWKRFLALFFGAVIITGVLQAGITYLLPGSDRSLPIVGASGAVSAIVGVFAVRFYRSRIRFIGLPFQVPAILLLAFVLLIEMGATLWQLAHREGGTSVAHWAHIGGFILGMAFAQATRLFSAGQQEYLASDAAMEMQRGSLFAAVRRWEAVLRAQPDNPEAEVELAKAWALAGDREQSLTFYRKAIARSLKSGDKSLATTRYEEMRGFHAGASLSPTEQFAIGNALEEQNKLPEAIQAFETLVSHDPDRSEAEMARLRIGVLYLNRLNEPQQAIRVLQSFLEFYPRSEWRSYAEDLLRTARSRPGKAT